MKVDIKKYINIIKEKVNLKLVLLISAVVLILIALLIIVNIFTGPNKLAKKVVTDLGKSTTLYYNGATPLEREKRKLVLSKTTYKLVPGRSEITDTKKKEQYKAKKMYEYKIEVSTINREELDKKLREADVNDKSVKDQMKALRKAFNETKGLKMTNTNKLYIYKVEGDNQWSFSMELSY